MAGSFVFIVRLKDERDCQQNTSQRTIAKAVTSQKGTMKTLISGAFILTILIYQSHGQIYDTNGDFVQTFVGSGIPGYIDGQGQLTEFSGPSMVLADTLSNLFVWDSGNRLIRKVTSNGTVSTFVGGGNQFEGYGTNVSLAVNSSIGPMAIDHANKLWFLGAYYGTTLLVSVQTNGYVSVENGNLPNISVGYGLCFDSSDTLYYSGGNRIYRYNPLTAVADIFAGSGVSGHLDGNGIFTEFYGPGAIVADQADNLYVLDADGWIRRIDQAQNVISITNNFLGRPMAVDNNGNIIAVGGGGSVSYVCKQTVTTNVILFAGTLLYSPGSYTNGPGYLARFNTPTWACLSQGSIFVADRDNHRIRQISFNPQPQIVSGANLGIGNYIGLTISGIVGRTYQIQTSPDMNSWSTKASILLTSSPYFWVDQNPIASNKFYRALLLP